MPRFVTFVTTAIRLRALAVWAAVTVGTAGVGLLTGPVVAARQGGTFVEALTWGCAASALLAAIAAWLLATDVARSVLTGHPGSGRAVGPVRALLLVACGVTVLSGPAMAQPSPPDPAAEGAASSTDRDGRRVLDGLPLPDRPGGAERAAAAPARAVVTVRPGDTLWGLAEHDLGDRATAAAVAAHVRAIHQRNRAVIGSDPDLILPGQHLTLPPAPGRDQR